jgi:signal transduction histidine kinase
MAIDKRGLINYKQKGKWHWLVIPLFMLIVISIEYAEHYDPDQLIPVGIEFYREALIYGVVLPLIAGLLVDLLQKKEKERKIAVEHLENQMLFRQQLGSVSSLDELTQLIVQYPKKILPVLGTTLYVYDPQAGGLELAAGWYLDNSPSTDQLIGQSLEPCINCKANQLSPVGALKLGDEQSRLIPYNKLSRLCLPLIHAGQRVALVHVDFEESAVPTKEQLRLLNSIAPVMAMAINNVLTQREAQKQAISTENERRRMAQELHDTLGQNIAYLRLKLDQLSEETIVADAFQIQQELEKMRVVANEASQQVRNTLGDLNISLTADIDSLLLEQVNKLKNRSNVEVKFNSVGRPHILPQPTKRQIYYICSEALSNILRHADASLVIVDTSWLEDKLEVIISDNGRGFDPQLRNQDAHFGLHIMHERAEDIKADLKVESSPGMGTKIRLLVPYSGTIENDTIRCATGEYIKDTEALNSSTHD